MNYTKDFSVVVPVWRGAIKCLPRLFDSIPEKDGVEIIVVDNSPNPISRDEIDSQREVLLLHSAPERHAGGSRNDGIACAKGKWLLFADADDFYAPNAFDVFYSKIDSDSDIIYTGMGGIYQDTGELSDRGHEYADMVHKYCIGKANESLLRFHFSSPCCKMVSHKLIDEYNIRFDEIKASNDIFFSLTSGYYAKTIDAVDTITYIATVSKGSLTQRRDFDVISARLYAMMHCNQFLKKHGLKKEQRSIMHQLYEARYFSLSQKWNLFKMILKFRQNIFVGWKRWANSFLEVRKRDKLDNKYIVR